MGSRTLKNGVENNKKDLSAMPSYVPSVPTSTSSYLSLSALRVCNSKMGEGEFMGFYVHYKYRRGTSLGVNVLFRYQLVTCGNGAEANAIRSSQLPDFGNLDQFRIEDAIDLTRNPLFNQIKSSSQALADAQFGALSKTLASADNNLSAAVVGSQTLPLQKDNQPNLPHISVGRENWGDSNMADGSPRTDTSTDDTEEKNQRFGRGQTNAIVASDSSDRSKDKTDQKTLRRLAQNREAARKSRLRKKAYVQQLESSRLKLTQLEQELQRARQQGIFISSTGDQSHSMSGNGAARGSKFKQLWMPLFDLARTFMDCYTGALAFDVEYSRWLEEHNKHINELRAAVNSHAGDAELRTIVDSVTAHFDDIFRLKGIAAKADVFHILSGMWKTPAERCFLWIGGFRSSELLKLLASQLEPLTEQQFMGIQNLQQSSQQAEDALSQGMEALQQSLAETLANGSPAPSGPSGNVANYMGQMAMAMGKLGTLEGFLRQADNLRQQTLQQMHRILTTRQSARALLAINDYFSRLRALSSLWLARPR
ncbi:hypothetical protein Godav_028604, partial [Gossypium davidsonii]|nr:hypothetical protein [Gossypium davidsonii]